MSLSSPGGWPTFYLTTDSVAPSFAVFEGWGAPSFAIPFPSKTCRRLEKIGDFQEGESTFFAFKIGGFDAFARHYADVVVESKMGA
jgi:hypothetical protein